MPSLLNRGNGGLVEPVSLRVRISGTMLQRDHAPLDVSVITFTYFQPALASDDLLQLLPPVVTYVAEHDVLKDDGVLLHKRLRMIGGKSELIQWDGGIHAQVVFSF